MDGWAILYIGLNDFGPFSEVYGHVAGNDVLCFTATVTGEAVDELGAPDDFIGHTAANDFVVITTPKRAQAIKEKVKGRFAAEVGTFYKFKHREGGYGTVTEADEQEKPMPQRFPKWAPEGQNRTFDFWMPFRWLARILGRKSPEIKPASRSPLAISVPLMTLAVGIITQDDGPFADIREITERAAEARREDGRR